MRIPAGYTPRADAHRRALHVGDSMVFGLGVERAERLQHLGAILRTARDALARRGIAFRVVILPGHLDPADDAARDATGERGELLAVVREQGIPVIDAAPVLRAAVREGRDLFVRPLDPHFNRDGHRLIADWLHRAWDSAS